MQNLVHFHGCWRKKPICLRKKEKREKRQAAVPVGAGHSHLPQVKLCGRLRPQAWADVPLNPRSWRLRRGGQPHPTLPGSASLLRQGPWNHVVPGHMLQPVGPLSHLYPIWRSWHRCRNSPWTTAILEPDAGTVGVSTGAALPPRA